MWVHGSGFRVQGSGFRVHDFRVYDLGFLVSGAACRVFGGRVLVPQGGSRAMLGGLLEKGFQFKTLLAVKFTTQH